MIGLDVLIVRVDNFRIMFGDLYVPINIQRDKEIEEKIISIIKNEAIKRKK